MYFIHWNIIFLETYGLLAICSLPKSLRKTNDYFIKINYNNNNKNIDWANSFLCHIPYLYNLEKQVIILIFLIGKLKIKSFNKKVTKMSFQPWSPWSESNPCYYIMPNCCQSSSMKITHFILRIQFPISIRIKRSSCCCPKIITSSGSRQYWSFTWQKRQRSKLFRKSRIRYLMT